MVRREGEKPAHTHCLPIHQPIQSPDVLCEEVKIIIISYGFYIDVCGTLGNLLCCIYSNWNQPPECLIHLVFQMRN